MVTIRHFKNEKGTGGNCVPQLFLGKLLATRRSDIGQLFFLSLVAVPEVSAKLNLAHVPSRFLSGDSADLCYLRRMRHYLAFCLLKFSRKINLK